jgi:hypothetical protein
MQSEDRRYLHVLSNLYVPEPTSKTEHPASLRRNVTPSDAFVPPFSFTDFGSEVGTNTVAVVFGGIVTFKLSLPDSCFHSLLIGP